MLVIIDSRLRKLAAGAQKSQEFGRWQDADRLEGLDAQQVVVAAYDDVGPTIHGRFKHHVVPWVPNLCDAPRRHDRFAPKQDQCHHRLDILRSEPVLVAESWTVEDVSHFRQERLAVDQDEIRIAQMPQHWAGGAPGLDDRANQDVGVNNRAEQRG